MAMRACCARVKGCGSTVTGASRSVDAPMRSKTCTAPLASYPRRYAPWLRRVAFFGSCWVSPRTVHEGQGERASSSLLGLAGVANEIVQTPVVCTQGAYQQISRTEPTILNLTDLLSASEQKQHWKLMNVMNPGM